MIGYLRMKVNYQLMSKLFFSFSLYGQISKHCLLPEVRVRIVRPPDAPRPCLSFSHHTQTQNRRTVHFLIQQAFFCFHFFILFSYVTDKIVSSFTSNRHQVTKKTAKIYGAVRQTNDNITVRISQVGRTIFRFLGKKIGVGGKLEKKEPNFFIYFPRMGTQMCNQ